MQMSLERANQTFQLYFCIECHKISLNHIQREGTKNGTTEQRILEILSVHIKVDDGCKMLCFNIFLNLYRMTFIILLASLLRWGHLVSSSGEIEMTKTLLLRCAIVSMLIFKVRSGHTLQRRGKR